MNELTWLHFAFSWRTTVRGSFGLFVGHVDPSAAWSSLKRNAPSWIWGFSRRKARWSQTRGLTLDPIRSDLALEMDDCAEGAEDYVDDAGLCADTLRMVLITRDLALKAWRKTQKACVSEIALLSRMGT